MVAPEPITIHPDARLHAALLVWECRPGEQGYELVESLFPTLEDMRKSFKRILPRRLWDTFHTKNTHRVMSGKLTISGVIEILRQLDVRRELLPYATEFIRLTGLARRRTGLWEWGYYRSGFEAFLRAGELRYLRALTMNLSESSYILKDVFETVKGCYFEDVPPAYVSGAHASGRRPSTTTLLEVYRSGAPSTVFSRYEVYDAPSIIALHEADVPSEYVEQTHGSFILSLRRQTEITGCEIAGFWEAGVPSAYVRAGVDSLVPHETIIQGHREGVPIEFLTAVI